MFGHVARIVSRPAAAAAAATVAANAAQGSAHARAPAPPQGARQAVHPSAHSKIVDRDTEGWILAEMNDQMVVFQPFNEKEVDEAASTVMSLWAGRGSTSSSQAIPIISEPGEDVDDGRSSCTMSEGGDEQLADAVIEAAAATKADALSVSRIQEREELERLMTITTRMLRRPGMQREVVLSMMEDPEIAQLMLRQCDNLDRYLLAAGVHNPHLLPAPTMDADSSNPEAGAGSPEGAVPGPQQHFGPNLVERLVGTLAGVMERAGAMAGNALASMGNWLRKQLRMFQGNGEEGAEVEGEGAAADGHARGQRTASQVLGGVMVLVVAVVCVMVIRRPLVLNVIRTRSAAAAGTAAFAAAAAAKAKSRAQKGTSASVEAVPGA